VGVGGLGNVAARSHQWRKSRAAFDAVSVRPLARSQIAMALFAAPRSKPLRQLRRVSAQFQQFTHGQLRECPPQQNRRSLVNCKILEV
jgi:hypothetical protein